MKNSRKSYKTLVPQAPQPQPLRYRAMSGSCRIAVQHHAVIRAYDAAGNVIETRDHTGDCKD